VHLLVALPLELVVEDTRFSALATVILHKPRKGDILRTSYPNWGYSKHSDLNSSSASARSVCERVAQKLAIGARTVLSSLLVLA